MSATNRGGQRTPADFYPTPAWCVWRLLEARALPGGRWLEPCAGTGAIVQAVQDHRTDVQWTTIELREACRETLTGLDCRPTVHIRDFVEHGDEALYDVVITNPPYSCAQQVLTRAMALAPTVVMLLRLNFLASAGRAGFMREHPPDVYVLPNRPSFDGKGTDSIEYAWFVWRPTLERHSGEMRVLAPTPLQERRAVSRS
jgi:hypothetical protein